MGQVLYAGGEMDSVEIVAGSPVEIVASYDSTYSRGSISGNYTSIHRERCYDSNSIATTVAAGQTCFSHGLRSFAGTASFFDAVRTIEDASGHPWITLRPPSAGALACYVNTGTGASPVWSTLGTGTKAWNNNQTYADDIRVYIDPAGLAHEVEWIVDQTRVSIGTFANAGFTNIASVTKCGPNNAGGFWSQGIITEGLSTVGAHVFTSDLSGAGNYSQWTGTNPDAVNEVILDDTTSWQTSTAGNKSTGATKNFTTPAGYVLPSIFVWTRVKQSGSSPQNANIVIRTGGTDYPLALASPGVGFSNFPLRMDVNPATGTVWTDTAWNAAERGIEAVA